MNLNGTTVHVMLMFEKVFVMVDTILWIKDTFFIVCDFFKDITCLMFTHIFLLILYRSIIFPWSKMGVFNYELIIFYVQQYNEGLLHL